METDYDDNHAAARQLRNCNRLRRMLRPSLGTSSKPSSMPFSKSALSPRQLNEPVERPLARFRKGGKVTKGMAGNFPFPPPPVFQIVEIFIP